QQDPVGDVPETARGSDFVDGEEVGALPDRLALAEFGDGGGIVAGLRPEADDDLPGAATLDEAGEDVGVAHQFDRRGRVGVGFVLLDLRLRACFGAEVSDGGNQDRKSTRLNSSHVSISYAVF